MVDLPKKVNDKIKALIPKKERPKELELYEQEIKKFKCSLFGFSTTGMEVTDIGKLYLLHILKLIIFLTFIAYAPGIIKSIIEFIPFLKLSH